MSEKETEKGLMHSFFGAELCDGCKGLVVFAFVAPTRKDMVSFAECLSGLQKAVDAAGKELAMKAAAGASPSVKSGARSSFVDTPAKTEAPPVSTRNAAGTKKKVTVRRTNVSAR